jgi:putative Mg2+ transporter-C (MgtC) family protein
MLEQIAAELGGSFSRISPGISAARLTSAAILAAIIGLEREIRGKPAGLRTHILIAIAAAMFILISVDLAAMEFDTDDVKRVDPLRLIEATTAGVAFLAAGVIFTSGGKVQNITTGASMWLAGAIGLACGAGQVLLAAMATFIVLIVLFVLRQIEKLIGTHH